MEPDRIQLIVVLGDACKFFFFPAYIRARRRMFKINRRVPQIDDGAKAGFERLLTGKNK
jgi:hypothetical protein